jgi:hypothetical protein
VTQAEAPAPTSSRWYMSSAPPRKCCASTISTPVLTRCHQSRDANDVGAVVATLPTTAQFPKSTVWEGHYTHDGGAPSRTSPTDGTNEQTEPLNLRIKNTKRGKPIPHNRQTPASPIPNHGQSSRIRTRRASLVAWDPKSLTRRGFPDRIPTTRARHPYRRGDRERAEFECRDTALQRIGTVPPTTQRSSPRPTSATTVSGWRATTRVSAEGSSCCHG